MIWKIAGLSLLAGWLSVVGSAREYYEEVVSGDPNGEYARDAKDALRKLKKK
jgi:hypothetical protein